MTESKMQRGRRKKRKEGKERRGKRSILKRLLLPSAGQNGYCLGHGKAAETKNKSQTPDEGDKKTTVVWNLPCRKVWKFYWNCPWQRSRSGQLHIWALLPSPMTSARCRNKTTGSRTRSTESLSWEGGIIFTSSQRHFFRLKVEN